MMDTWLEEDLQEQNFVALSALMRMLSAFCKIILRKISSEKGRWILQKIVSGFSNKNIFLKPCFVNVILFSLLETVAACNKNFPKRGACFISFNTYWLARYAEAGLLLHRPDEPLTHSKKAQSLAALNFVLRVSLPPPQSWEPRLPRFISFF